MRRATSLSIGDRDLPLEGDLDCDFFAAHPLVGEKVKVSPIAGGDLLGIREENAEVVSVLLRLGEIVGLTVKLEGKTYRGSLKDFFLDRKVLEDIQPPSPLSKAIREGLSHWKEQRTYWATRIDGLESFCFELSSSAASAEILTGPWGWSFKVPDTLPGRVTMVDCRAVLNGNFWVLSTSVYPKTGTDAPRNFDGNPWVRTFSWAKQVATDLCAQGFPWEESLKNLEIRKRATERILQPLIDETLPKVLAEKRKLVGRCEDPGPVYGAFSDVRLKSTFVGLTEPPTDRRPYTVMSLTPKCCKTRDYLQQVVLHECIHVAVGSRGGEPHNEEFQRLARKLGLKPEHRN